VTATVCSAGRRRKTCVRFLTGMVWFSPSARRMNSVVLAETEPRDVPSEFPAEILSYGGCWETEGDDESFIVVCPVQVEFGSGLAIEL
jgi:hypothetical protein